MAEVALRDGARAHVPWLRELPDPLDRVSWSPCVRVAPERARALGVGDGDIVAVRVEGATVEMPARILPGQHPPVLGLPVGYGTVDGRGRAEANAFRLARSKTVSASSAAGSWPGPTGRDGPSRFPSSSPSLPRTDAP